MSGDQLLKKMLALVLQAKRRQCGGWLVLGWPLRATYVQPIDAKKIDTKLASRSFMEDMEEPENPVYEGLRTRSRFNAKHEFMGDQGTHYHHIFKQQLITRTFMNGCIMASDPLFSHSKDNACATRQEDAETTGSIIEAAALVNQGTTTTNNNNNISSTIQGRPGATTLQRPHLDSSGTDVRYLSMLSVEGLDASASMTPVLAKVDEHVASINDKLLKIYNQIKHK